MELAEFRLALDSWLDENEAILTEDHEATATLDAQMAHLAKVKRMAYEAGFMRWGWPAEVGASVGAPLWVERHRPGRGGARRRQMWLHRRPRPWL